MRRNPPVPRGTRSSAHARSAVLGIAAVLALSACGSAGGAGPDEDPTATASATATPSASAGATRSASPDPSGTTTPAATPAAPDTTAAAAGEHDDPQPEPERTASAPELGMPPATPFTPSAGDGQGVCDPSQLSGAVANEQGAAGSVIASLTLTNTGGSPCVLDGYPGVSFVAADGAIIGVPAGRDASAPGTALTLQPGASASAALKVTRAGMIGTCNPHDAAGLRVYPPGSHESLVIPYPAQACGNPKVRQLQVKAFGS